MDPLQLISQQKLKRYFRATRKFNHPNLVSHITQRAAGKEPLFIENDDYLSMLQLLKEISKIYSLSIYTFCLMPNHLHLLLSPKEKNLYDAMRDLFSRYAMRFNRKYERKGHLFGGPYRQAVCLHDSYLIAASLYIHLNPVNADLSQSPIDYRWSSCRLFWYKNAPKSFIDPDFILRILPGVDAKRKRRYRQLLERGVALKAGVVFEQEDTIEQFRNQIADLFPSLFEKIDWKTLISDFSGINLSDINNFDRQIRKLATKSFPNKAEGTKARKYLIEQLIARGYKRTEIAEKLGISRKTVYNILNSSLQLRPGGS